MGGKQNKTNNNNNNRHTHTHTLTHTHTSHTLSHTHTHHTHTQHTHTHTHTYHTHTHTHTHSLSLSLTHHTHTHTLTPSRSYVLKTNVWKSRKHDREWVLPFCAQQSCVSDVVSKVGVRVAKSGKYVTSHLFPLLALGNKRANTASPWWGAQIRNKWTTTKTERTPKVLPFVIIVGGPTKRSLHTGNNYSRICRWRCYLRSASEK